MRICVILAFLLLPFYGASAQDLKHAFLSPAFTGIGFSAHVLTVENQEFSRMESIESDIATLLREQDRAANSTNLSKFMNNVESRIYAQLSKQMVDNMFGENPQNEGFFSFEGTDISYIKTDELVTLTIVNTDGTTTTVSVPVGDFTF
jgi:hypothetical protein